MWYNTWAHIVEGHSLRGKVNIEMDCIWRSLPQLQLTLILLDSRIGVWKIPTNWYLATFSK